MVAGAHPGAVNRGRRLRDGDVFLQHAEVRASLRGALFNIRLAGIAVGDCPLGNHAQAVLPGGRGQRGIPAERRRPCAGARLIGQQDDLPSFRLDRVGALNLCSPVLKRLRQNRGRNQRHAHRQTLSPDAHNQLNTTLSLVSRYSWHVPMPFPITNVLDHAGTRIRTQPLAAAGILLLAGFVLGGLAAPWLAPHNPAAIDLLHRLQGPSAAHWAGTDELGRDTLSRLLWGARLSLAVSVTVVTVSLALGLAIGGLAGYQGGWVDTALTTFAMNTFLALPGILLAIAFAAFLGPGFANLVLALAIGGWAGYARLVRAQVMAVRDREYVDAARALGASGMRIFFRHILPNIVQPILVQAAIGMAGVILAEATLSFLGLGIPAPAPSWGSMLNDARLHLFDSPHLVLFPALAIAGAVLGFNFLGDALRDRLDPRTRLELGL